MILFPRNLSLIAVMLGIGLNPEPCGGSCSTINGCILVVEPVASVFRPRLLLCVLVSMLGLFTDAKNRVVGECPARYVTTEGKSTELQCL